MAAGVLVMVIKGTEGAAQVSCDPQATPRGSCDRHSTRSARVVADIDGPWPRYGRTAYEFGMRRRPRDARAGGAVMGARAVRVYFPGRPPPPPGARPGAAKTNSGISY